MEISFADCVLDTAQFTLTRGGEPVSIEPQVLDLLIYLAQRPGELVTKDDLIEAVWGGRIVSDSAISARISAARRAVGDDGQRQAVIRTVPRRGVQFVADLAAPSAPAAPAVQTTQTPTIRYATADDGTKIAYAVAGSGPPLIRVAHFPTHLELEWSEPSERALFDELMQHSTLIRVDQRGSGLSDLDVDDFSTKRSARDLLAVADALELDRFALFGKSSGAMVMVEAAVLAPDRVTKIITMGGYVDGRSLRAPAGSFDETILKMTRQGWDSPGSAFISAYAELYFPTATRAQIEEITLCLQQSSPLRSVELARTYFNNHSIASLLPQVQAPTLVIHSRDDGVHPLSEGQKMARGIPNAELLILESPNHYPLPQEPAWDVMREALARFLGG